MSWIWKLLKIRWVGGALGVVLCLSIWAAFWSPKFALGKGLIGLSYDLPMRFRPTIDIDEVAMVYMDEESAKNLKQPRSENWDRQIHAALLKKLKEAGAKAVVFDVVFTGPSRSGAGTNSNGLDPADAAFAAAIHDFGNVALAADLTLVGTEGAIGRGGKTVDPPYEPFLDGAEAIGTATLDPSSDLVVRNHPFSDPNLLVPTLSVAAAQMAGIDTDLLAPSAERWINYYGPPLWLPHISYSEVLFPQGAGNPDLFRNRVVFVGGKFQTKSLSERKDEYLSPYAAVTDEDRLMPGVEIQATLFLNLLRRDWLTRMDWGTERLLCILAAVLFGYALTLLPPLYATLAGAVAAVGIWAGAYYSVTTTHVWFAWLVIELEVGVAVVWSVVFNSVNLFVQNLLMEHSLGMYVSPRRVKQIMRNPDRLMKPGAEKQEVSILFSDIANFTTMSEGLDSDDLAKLMNRYFESAVTHCIHRTEGTVIKFIGDAIFSIWNAPEPQANHQELACRGALLLRDQVTSFDTGHGEVRTRIGLHSGVANVGNFGSSARVDYTAIGENINLASRMEGLNKYLGTDVLITGDVERSVRGRFVVRLVGNFRLKGFEKHVEVFELLGMPETASESEPWRKRFAEALLEFRRRHWDEAEAGFRCVLEVRPKDGPALFYLKQIDEFRQHPPASSGWAGEIELKEK